jgi:hypothetical protein
MRIHLLRLTTVSTSLLILATLTTPELAQTGEPTTTNEQTVVEELFKKILEHGFTIALPTLAEIKSQVEIHGDLAIFSVPVTLKATDAARESLEAATRRLGGQTIDAFYEADYGIVSWEARAVRLSSDPRTLEYIQRRIGSIAFALRLALDDAQSYECSTDDVWRLPITPIQQLFNYGGRAAIQGLGISPVFDSKDYGFIAARKKPITFIYRGTMPASDFAKIVKMEGKILEAKGTDSESECRKASAGPA